MSAHVSESVSRVPIPRDGLHQLISKEHNDAIPLIFDDHGRRRGLECRGIAIQPHAARKRQLIEYRLDTVLMPQPILQYIELEPSDCGNQVNKKRLLFCLPPPV
jgi:hypothetical protein